MAFAVFTDDEKLSRTFPTKEEALKKADEAGLVDRSKGEPVLENDLTVKPCPADPEQKNDEDLDWSPQQAPYPGRPKD
jgi:hypothetical protein